MALFGDAGRFPSGVVRDDAVVYTRTPSTGTYVGPGSYHRSADADRRAGWNKRTYNRKQPMSRSPKRSVAHNTSTTRISARGEVTPASESTRARGWTHGVMHNGVYFHTTEGVGHSTPGPGSYTKKVVEDTPSCPSPTRSGAQFSPITRPYSPGNRSNFNSSAQSPTQVYLSTQSSPAVTSSMGTGARSSPLGRDVVRDGVFCRGSEEQVGDESPGPGQYTNVNHNQSTFLKRSFNVRANTSFQRTEEKLRRSFSNTSGDSRGSPRRSPSPGARASPTGRR